MRSEPRDPNAGGEAFPFPFAAFNDPERALALLQPHGAELFGAPSTLTRCDVVDSLYKTYVNPASWPKSTLSVCWRIEYADAGLMPPRPLPCEGAGPPSQRPGGGPSAMFVAKVYLEGRSQAAWRQLLECDHDAAAPPVAMHVPALDMIVWRFPHDPALRHLPEAVLEDRVRARLPWDALRARGAGPAESAQLHVEPVQYQPGKSCTTRYRLHWRGVDAAQPPHEQIVYAKTFGDDRGRAAYTRQQHYWRTAALRTCEPLAYDDSIDTMWSLGVEGRPLASVIDDANRAHYLEQVAGHLWAVHASDARELGVTEAIDTAELLADCLKKIDKLGQACPLSRAPLARVAAQLQGLRVMRDGGQRCVLHGDFHIGQTLAVGSDVYLFDFDSFALGDPEQDLAEFVVALLFTPASTKSRARAGSSVSGDGPSPPLGGTFDPAFVRTTAAALGQAYAAHARRPVRLDHLRWYARVEFVTRCWRFHREHRPGWADALLLALNNLPALDDTMAAVAAGVGRDPPPLRR